MNERDMEELSYLYLDQSVYIDKILKKFNMEMCRPISTPAEVFSSWNLESETIV
jgi:hypothetical protein